VAVPEDSSGSLRARVARVGRAVRPAVALLPTEGTAIESAGVFIEPSLVVTTASALPSGTPEIRTLDGQTYDGTLLGETAQSGDHEDDVAAVRVDATAPTISLGSAADLSTDDTVIHIGHEFRLGEWLIQYGPVRGRTDEGDRFVTFFPLPTSGGPVVTLDGELVGIAVGTFGIDPPATEIPPPTESSTVYTDRSQWNEVRNEPISDVRARVAEWTD
jgi:S1-C subfamily serine protease